jgi:uncharacterized membrane protein
MKTLLVILSMVIFYPFSVSAQTPPNDFFDLAIIIASWFQKLIPVLIGIIVVIVFWNLAQFVLHADDEKEREKYKMFMVWSVVGMFLIVSFWGIIGAIINTFFTSSSNPALARPGYVDKDGRPAAP